MLKGLLDPRVDEAERVQRYGSLATSYRLVGHDEAEIAVLPRVREATSTEEVRNRVREAERYGLRTLVFGGTDFEPINPFDSVIQLHPGPTRGAQRHGDVLALPFFFTDRTLGTLEPFDSEEVPSVAFCGQGHASALQAAKSLALRVLTKSRNLTDPKVVAPPIRGHVRLRHSALTNLAATEGVRANFVIRDQYRAGASSQEERERTQSEFDSNLCSSTYALCIRGTGNFSARFSEALHFGRIPLFIDTRCVLPHENLVDWQKVCVWLDEKEVLEIGPRLITAHQSRQIEDTHSAETMRGIWEQYLSSDGYFRHLVPTVRSLI
ncbi:MAG: exostosin family protein [Acidimicrobiales bacterium]|nr:exostosin family protein [Acidimicrobiales bacterium]